MLAYYRAISEATPLPLIVYEIPVRTGRTTPLPELERLLSLETVVGLKYSASDLFAFGRMRAAFPDKTFYFGSDEMLGGAAALGADGGIGSTYNVLGGSTPRSYPSRWPETSPASVGSPPLPQPNQTTRAMLTLLLRSRRHRI